VHVGPREPLPPLRERREDYSLLVASLLSKIPTAALTFSPDAARALLRHSGPLNVRELEKSLSAAAVLSRGERLEVRQPYHASAVAQICRQVGRRDS
jgi:DNA-binding NtrC family response regulator